MVLESNTKVRLSSRFLRLTQVALLAALLGWLIADGSPQARRIDRLNATIAAGKMYQLTRVESETLSKTVTWLASAAGISGTRIAINEHYSTPDESAPVLQVYVTRPDEIGITGCPAYNAIYDPELDAIFLDQSFIALSEWKQALAAPDGEWGLDIPLGVKDVPSINVFFRFVLLHELGHRQLHRRSKTWFFSEAMSRRREEEADAFALEKMKAAFSYAPSFGIEAVEEYTGDLIHYPVKRDMPIEEQVEASLVEMIKVILGAQLSLPTASPTFAVAHSDPNVVTRLVSLMDTASRTYHSDGMLQVLAQYTQLQARGVEKLASVRPLEIRSTLPITGLAWGGKAQGLLVRAAADGLYRLPAEALADATTSGATLDVDHALVNITPSLSKRSSMWIRPDGSIVAPVPERSNGQHLQKASLFPTFSLQNSDVMFGDERVVLQGMIAVAFPWPYALFRAAVGDRQWLVIVHDTGQVQNVELSRLMEAGQRLVGPQKVAIDFGAPTFAPNGIYFPVVSAVDKEIRFRGFGYVDATTLEFQRVILPILLDSCAYSTTENPLVDARFGFCQFSIRADGSQERVFQAQLMPQPPENWVGEAYSYGERMEVWELSTGKQPRLVTTQPLALALARRGGISNDAMSSIELSPRFRHTGIDRANARSVWFNLDDDSLYALRLSNNSLATQFPLAGANLRLAEDDKGDLYVAELNGYKIFRLSLEQQ